MSHKICVCGKVNRGHVHICSEHALLHRANKIAAKIKRQQQILKLHDANLNLHSPHELKTSVFDPLLQLANGVENINNFFKMRHIPIGKILFWTLVTIIAVLIVMFAPIGVD